MLGGSGSGSGSGSENNGSPDRPGRVVPAGYDPSRDQRPSVACDVAIVAFIELRLKVLLIRRGQHPYQGAWALPGGFVEIDESLEAAAARELLEETGLTGVNLIHLGAYGDPRRDPRTRVISVAFLALVRADRLEPQAGDDAREVAWHELADLPELAFDHHLILADLKVRLRELAVLSDRLLALLPETFTPDAFLELARQVTGLRYDRDAFIQSLERTPSFLRQANGGYRYDPNRQREGDFVFLLFGQPRP